MATIYAQIPSELNAKMDREIPPRMKSAFIARAIGYFFDSGEAAKYLELLNQVNPNDARTA